MKIKKPRLINGEIPYTEFHVGTSGGLETLKEDITIRNWFNQLIKWKKWKLKQKKTGKKK